MRSSDPFLLWIFPRIESAVDAEDAKDDHTDHDHDHEHCHDHDHDHHHHDHEHDHKHGNFNLLTNDFLLATHGLHIFFLALVCDIQVKLLCCVCDVIFTVRNS